MDIMTQELNIERVTGRSAVQAAVEGRISLPEGVNDIARVLDAQGEITLTGAEALEGRLMINEAISLDMICADKADEPVAFTADTSFSHCVELAGASPAASAHVLPQLQMLEVKPDSGGLKVSAVVDMLCRAHDDTPVRMLTGIRGAGELEKRCTRLSKRAVKRTGSGKLRLREEIAQEGAVKAVCARGYAAVQQVTGDEDGILVEGTLNVSVLYIDAKGELAHTTQALPFEEHLDCSGEEATAYAEQIKVSALGEEFGIISVEAVICVDAYSTEDSEAEVINDAYLPTLPFECVREDIEAFVPYGRVQRRVNLRENVELDDAKPDIDRVLMTSVRPLLTGVQVGEGRLSAEFVLNVNIIYQCPKGSVNSFETLIPFAAESDAAAGATQADVRIETAGASCVGAGRSAVVSASLMMTAEPFDTKTVALAVDAVPAELRRGGGMAIYVAGEGETLFDVAKRFMTTREQILAVNPELTETLAPGQKLLLYIKRMA